MGIPGNFPHLTKEKAAEIVIIAPEPAGNDHYLNVRGFVNLTNITFWPAKPRDSKGNDESFLEIWSGGSGLINITRER